ncbi:hypothetical protein V5799_024303, partial [Amblyomma americanum]
MMYAVFFLGIYYNVILGYSLTYLYYSFWKILPWTECNPDWTNEYCFVQGSEFVAFFTAVVPILILGVLLTRGVTLQGANWGLAYYLLPDWKKILDYAVWQKAAEQVFFSLGVAQGMTITMGSYNDFSNNLYKDVYIIVFADLLVSFVGGIVVFSVLGNMAYNLRLAVPDVVNS